MGDNTLDFPTHPTKADRSKAVRPEAQEVTPQDSVSNVGSVRESDLLSLHPEHTTLKAAGTMHRTPWSAITTGEVSTDAQQRMSRYIVGTCLQRFSVPDPAPEVIAAYMRETSGRRGDYQLKHFTKWMENTREVLFEGRNDVALFLEWQETITYYFMAKQVDNKCTQHWLATQTVTEITLPTLSRSVFPVEAERIGTTPAFERCAVEAGSGRHHRPGQ